MYFEDEKDIIDDGSNLHIAEDGTVSWDDILVDAENEVNSDDIIYEDEAGNEIGGVESIRNGDPSEVEYVEDPLNSSDVSINDDDEQPQYIAEEYASEDNISDDFDIDKQLESLTMSEEEGNEDFTMPAKENKKSSSIALLLALLVALGVMAGIWFFFTKFQTGKSELVKPSTKTEMDNMTSDQFDERTAQNADSLNMPSTSDEAIQRENAALDNNGIQEPQIPIINDDNVKDLKPDPKEEKKQVISIIPTGRINPFLPLQKYSEVNVKETIVQFDKVGIPKPPSTVPKEDVNITKMLSIAVSGIMYDSQNPSAIITLENNDYFVKKGDKLDNYKVIEIGRNYVTVAFGNNLYKANVGEEFKITSKIPGSAQYLADGRQYYSVNVKKADTKKTDSKTARQSTYNLNNTDKYENIENLNNQSSYGKSNSFNNNNYYVSEDEVEIKTKE